MSEIETYKVFVDFSLSLSEMVAAGKYDRVNSDIFLYEEYFPPVGRKEEIEIIIPFFPKYAKLGLCTAKASWDEMEKEGLRRASLQELLALGAQHPELLLKKKRIIAPTVLICPEDGAWVVPVLAAYSGRREFVLLWFDMPHFYPGHCYIAVRKEQYNVKKEALGLRA